MVLKAKGNLINKQLNKVHVKFFIKRITVVILTSTVMCSNFSNANPYIHDKRIAYFVAMFNNDIELKSATQQKIHPCY